MANDNGDDFGAPYMLRQIATKVDRIADTTASKVEVAFLSARMDSMVPRSEHDVHWKRDDDRFRNIDDKLDEHGRKLDVLMSDRLPRWVLPSLGLVIAFVSILAAHFWKP